MKFLITLGLVISAFNWSTIAAQTPINSTSNADMVFTIRGGKLLEKVSLKEMKKMDAVNQIFGQMVKATGEADREIDQLGINLNSNAQLFVSFGEEGTILMGTSFEVNDPKAYKKIFMGDAPIESEVGVDFSVTDGYTIALKGNQGLITYSAVNPTYENESSIYDYSEIEEKAIEWEEGELILDFEIIEPEVVEDALDSAEEEVLNLRMETVEETYDDEEVIDDTIYQSNQDQQEAEEAKRREELGLISKRYALELFASNFSSGKVYDLDSEKTNPNADFSLVINGYSSMYNYIMNSQPNFYRSSTEIQLQEILTDMYADFKWVAMDGFYEKDQFRIEVNTKLSDDLADWYNNMMDAEVNPEILNNIPYEDHLAFVSGSYNTENMFKGYYDYFKKIAKSIPKTDDIEVGEVSAIMIDFIDLFIDESAIAQLVKGDFYAGITDLNTYDIEYTTYEYDENWNYNEVTSVKQEVRPDFLIMFSTDDSKNINNLLRLAELSSEGKFKNHGDYYMLAAGKESPIDVYAMQKNGVVFIFSSQALFETIKSGGTKPSAKQKSSISDFSTIFSLNSQKLAEKVPLDELPSDVKPLIDYSKADTGLLTFTQKKIKNGLLVSEMNLSTPSDHNNSLEYFLTTLNELTEMMQSNNTYKN